jgi:hypothetical protein
MRALLKENNFTDAIRAYNGSGKKAIAYEKRVLANLIKVEARR